MMELWGVRRRDGRGQRRRQTPRVTLGLECMPASVASKVDIGVHYSSRDVLLECLAPSLSGSGWSG